MNLDASPAPLIASTANADLEQSLRDRLAQRPLRHGSAGELESLAIRLGLIQDTHRPRLRQPQMLVFAGDHGIAVDVTHPGEASTAELVNDILESRVALPVFAHGQGLHFHLVDSGLASPLAAQPGVMTRKIAHGTRNCRVAPAMSLEQVHAAIRAGMEIAQDLPGNAIGMAGLGIGAWEASTLIINRLAGLSLHDLMFAGPSMDALDLEHRLVVLQAAQTRHVNTDDPVEVLAAFGGFEIAMMVGAMLVAASQRRVLLVDGLPACAALTVAARIGGAVSDYCVFCRSSQHRGLDAAFEAFGASALLEIGLDTLDGTGVPLAWPVLVAAAALLNAVQDDPRAADGLSTRAGLLAGPPTRPLPAPVARPAPPSLIDTQALYAVAWPEGVPADESSATRRAS